MPATPERPLAPPQPINIMEKVKVEITKPTTPYGSSACHAQADMNFEEDNTIGVGLANRLYASPLWGTFGVRNNFSNNSGEMVMPLIVWFVCVARSLSSSKSLFTWT